MSANSTHLEIPQPEEIRQRLSECLQEARLLRSLLRVVSQTDQVQERSQPKLEATQ